MATHKKRMRNNLSLEDKVRVIDAYPHQPCYQKLANVFKCSGKQIRNIMLDKKRILAQHLLVQNGLASPTKRDVKDLDYKKFELIHKVMFEWYQRAKCYPGFGPITYKIIRERVLDARKALNIASFIPTNAWLVNFRNDCDRYPPDTRVGDEGLQSLDMKVIAKFVLQQLGITMAQMKLNYGIVANDSNGFKWIQQASVGTVPNNQAQSSKIVIQKTLPNPFNIVEVDSEEDEFSADDLGDGGGTESSAKENEKNYGLIKSSEDALKYLKPLEDFVLLKENFRAIGLITQLEAVFLKTSKS